MEVYYVIISFIFGTLLGSFYNVVGYRLPNNLSIVYPDSFCPKCKHKLKWYELIPIFSFFIQGGKCRNCKCKISWFYPTIEFLTGLLFMLSYIKYGFTPECLISMLIASFFVIVIVSDMNYLIIPDEVTFFFSLVMIIIKFAFFGVKNGINSILYGLLLFAIMYLVMLLGNKVLKKECLGGGDIKIMFFVGSILSPLEGLFSLFLASAIALPFSIIILYSKNKNKVVPFGPFILLGLLIVYYFNIDVIALFEHIKY